MNGNLIILILAVCVVFLIGGCTEQQKVDVKDSHDHHHGEEDDHSMATGSMADHSAHDDSSLQHSFLTTFGPGTAPHQHTFDRSKLEIVDDIARNPSDVPPPISRNYPALVKVHLIAKEVISEIAPEITYNFWTFNGTIPGPFIRVREGDTVELTLSNDKSSTHNHSIDLHAVTGPGGGASATQVAPGESKTIRFKALNPGTFIYHCATHNVPMHMTNGMYGIIVVEPALGLTPVNKEFYAMQGEIYTLGAIGEKGFQPFNAEKMLYEKPEYVVFNGRVKSLVDTPMKAAVGESIRIYFGNGGVSLISSFHIIGEIFDKVYDEGSTSPPHLNVQTTAVPAGGAGVVEFHLEVPGDYILVDHSLARLEKGAWGLLQVTGDENPDVYSSGE